MLSTDQMVPKGSGRLTQHPGCLAVDLAQVVDTWYPDAAKKDKGVLLVVTAGKEGAVTGGEGFVQVRKCCCWVQVRHVLLTGARCG